MKRFTNDIDLAVRGDEAAIHDIAEALAREGIVPRTDDAEEVVQAEDLVIYKVFAGRPQDLDDARRLLLLYPNVDRKRVRRHLQELAHIVEDTKVLDRLDETLASVKGPGRRGR